MLGIEPRGWNLRGRQSGHGQECVRNERERCQMPHDDAAAAYSAFSARCGFLRPNTTLDVARAAKFLTILEQQAIGFATGEAALASRALEGCVARETL